MLTFDLDPAVTPGMRDGICDLWTDVTNAGGAVGFLPPVTRDDVRPELMRHLLAMADGSARLLVGRDETGRVAATAFIVRNAHRLMRHWLSVYTVMVHPSHQGKGYGRELLAAVEETARGMDGIEGLRLTCRGGMGLERFYESCGYKEVGRVPGAIRAGEGDYRDDVTLWLSLH